MIKISNLVIVITLIFSLYSPVVSAMEDVETDHILAAILIKITHFIQWPNMDNKNNSIKLCFLGENKFGNSIDNAAEKHPYIVYPVRVFKKISDVENKCDILFVDGSRKNELRGVFDRLKDMPVLTVSDIEGFESSGGIVELGVTNNRLSISINVDSAKKAGLKVDSQLLFLSKGSDKRGKL